MNSISPTMSVASGRESLIEILKQLADSQASGCLYASEQSVTWSFFLFEGKITYGTHSIDPGEKLERHLYALSHANPKLTSEVRSQVRLSLGAQTQNSTQYQAETQAIDWLIEKGYLSTAEAGTLITNLTKEAVESFLLLRNITYQFIDRQGKSRINVCLDLHKLLGFCQNNLENWQSLLPQIKSPYQRPYLGINSKLESKLPPKKYEQLTKILKGLSFRQLAVLLKQDEFLLAKSFHPLIVDGTLVVCHPQPPFDRLPQFSVTPDLLSSSRVTNSPQYYTQAKIVCVDDSPSMLQVVREILGGHNFDIFSISDPVKALTEIIRIKPDLILLDIGMPNLDGYKLCRLIRNHSRFQKTPIVMVTGNTGFIDRAKAKVAGATDYLTKPFSRAELETTVFKYLDGS